MKTAGLSLAAAEASASVEQMNVEAVRVRNPELRKESLNTVK